MDEDDEAQPRSGRNQPTPAQGKNYITPAGHARLVAELNTLLRVERPKVVEIVSWAAGNGDRSENGDYIYGKKRLREIDRRAHFLTKRLKIAEVVDPAAQTRRDTVFFGATVTYVNGRDEQRRITILGADEAEFARGEVSLRSPIARALMRHRVGEAVHLQTPAGPDEIEVLAISYPEPARS